MLGWTIAAARPEETAAALQLLFAQADPTERAHLIERTRQLLRSGELAADALRLVHQDEKVLGAMLATPAPGSVGLVWPPQTIRSRERPALEDALVQDTLRWLGGQGVRLCQALLHADELVLAAPLLRNGFQQITSLCFLANRLEGHYQKSNVLPTIAFMTYGQDVHEAFAETLQETYEGTLDCPELNGIRSSDETLAGHKAQGRFDPSRWWLAIQGEEPVGVLLINALAEEKAWEIIYMGLIPSARGQGLGRQLLAKALHEARQARIKKLTLVVDRRNLPALQLYRRVGFEMVEQREVFLAILPPPR